MNDYKVINFDRDEHRYVWADGHRELSTDECEALGLDGTGRWIPDNHLRPGWSLEVPARAEVTEYDETCWCPGDAIERRGGLTEDNRCPICGTEWKERSNDG